MSRTRRIGALLFAILTMGGWWASGLEQYEEVQVENRTGYPLVKLYIAPSSRPAWGRNLLEREILRDTESRQVHVSALSEGERFFDILGVDTDGDRYLRSGADLTKGLPIVLTFRDFLEPSKESGCWEEYFEEYGNEGVQNSGQK